jgi:hypothetical protein
MSILARIPFPTRRSTPDRLHHADASRLVAHALPDVDGPFNLDRD